MNTRQRRKVRRHAARWIPKMWKAFHEAADFAERNDPVAAATHLRMCAISLHEAHRELTKKPMAIAAASGTPMSRLYGCCADADEGQNVGIQRASPSSGEAPLE